MQRPMCYHCKAVFEHPPDLYKHTTTHTCPICRQSFCQLRYLQEHFNAHNTGLRMCTKCDKIFPNWAELAKHMKTHPLDLYKHRTTHPCSHKCTKCDKAFADQAELEAHMTKHPAAATAQRVNKKLYLCKPCFSTFGTQDGATAHMKTHIANINSNGDLKPHVVTQTVSNAHMLFNFLEKTQESQIHKPEIQTHMPVCKDEPDSRGLVGTRAATNLTPAAANLSNTGLGVSVENYKSPRQTTAQKVLYIQPTQTKEQTNLRPTLQQSTVRPTIEQPNLSTTKQQTTLFPAIQQTPMSTNTTTLCPPIRQTLIHPPTHQILSCQTNLRPTLDLTNGILHVQQTRPYHHLPMHQINKGPPINTTNQCMPIHQLNSAQNSNLCTCAKCSKTFADQTELVKHMATHTNVTSGQGLSKKTLVLLYSCTSCDKKFLTLEAANAHIQTHRQNTKPKGSNTDSQDAKPKTVTQAPAGSQISGCDVESDSVKALSHKQPYKPYLCTSCDKTFVTLEDASTHMMETHTPKQEPQRAITEGQDTKSQNVMQTPDSGCDVERDSIKSLSHLQSFKCSLCNETFKLFSHLNKHMVSHTDNDPQQNSQHPPFLQVPHNDTHQTDPSTFQVCFCCGKQCQTSGHLKEHLKEHIVDRLACSKCGKSCSSPSDLRRHTMTHRGEKPHTCAVCSKQFIGASTFKEHMMSHTTEHSRKCSQCGKSRLKTHMRNHTWENPRPCYYCVKMLTNVYDMKKHMKTHAEDPFIHTTKQYMPTHQAKRHNYACTKCSETFSDPTKLVKHMETHTVVTSTPGRGKKTIVQPYSCKQKPQGAITECQDTKSQIVTQTPADSNISGCDVESDSINSLSEEQPFKCSLCSETFKLFSQWDKHMVSHVQFCHHCGKQFQNLDDLKEHLKEHVNVLISKKPFRCSQCGKRFSYFYNLKTHMVTHTGHKPYKCSHCGKTFALSHSLKRHMINHTGEKPYNCSICSRCFRSIPTLKYHMMTHTGMKRFTCPHCSSWFTGADGLKYHLMSHAGKTPYSCSKCGEQFMQAGSFKAHMRTHTKHRLHVSSHCGKLYKYAHTLRTHMMTHRKDEPQDCSLCGLQFTNRWSLEQHMSNHENYTDCVRCVTGFLTHTELEHHLVAHRYMVDMALCTQTV